MPTKPFLRFCLCLMALVALPALCEAQPGGFGGGRGGGGRGGGFGGLTDLLHDDDIVRSLGISDEQTEEADAIRDEMRDSAGGDQDIWAQFGEAESEEERNALMLQMQEANEARVAEAEEKLKAVLDEQQFARLREIYLQRNGVQALTRPDVVGALEISDDQVTAIRSIMQDRFAAQMELGFRADEEEVAAFNQEWDSRLLAVLSDEQRDQWEAEQGEPFVAVEESEVEDEAPTVADNSDADDDSDATSAEDDAPRAMRPFTAPEATNSFGEAADAAAPMLTFSFNDAPWEMVLRRLAEISGYTLDLTVEPPGSFTYFDPKEYNPTDALDVINGYLSNRGYLLVLRDNALVCINLDNPPPNLIPRVLLSDLPNYGRNSLVSVVIPAPGVDVEALAEQLEPLMGPQGKIVGLDATNALVVTDLAAIVEQVSELVAGITGGPEDIIFTAIRLEHISAAQAEPTVKTLLGIGTGVVSVAQGQPNPWGGGGGGGGWGGRGRGDDDDNDNGWQMPTATAQPKVTIDARTNSLLVAGTPSQIRIVEDALKIIDVEANAGEWGTGPDEPFLVNYTLTEANAREVAATINAMYPNSAINEDERNGFVHVLATQAQHQEISTLIRQLDGQGGASSVAAIRLSRMDPLVAVNMLNAMFIGDGANSPTIEADTYGRQIMIRGSQDQIAQARTLLMEMGEDGSGARQTGGTLQSFPLSSRDPQELLQLVEAMWGRQSNTPVTIIFPEERQQGDRVQFFGQGPEDSRDEEPRPPLEETSILEEPPLEDLVPGDSSPEPSVPSASVPTGTDAPRAQVHPLRDFARRDSLVLTSLDDGQALDEQDDAPAPPVAEDVQSADELDEPGDEQIAQPIDDVPQATEEVAVDDNGEDGSDPGVDLSEIRITVVGGEIIVEHPDPEVVDEMMALLETVIQTVPPRSSWKIFPLQVADATTVATLLQAVIPEATVVKNATTSTSTGLLGGLTSSVSNLGSGVMSMTGLDSMGVGSSSLQIIPELTHNALIVSGPQHLIDEVVVWLNILDSPDWPDNYRNREPKMIPVLYADSQDVYNILQQTYADILENDQSRQGREAQQALAAMFGGGGGRGGQQEQRPPATMTLSHDPRTNHIIVSANEELFLEVQAIVEDIDNAAREARRTVQVVQLQYGNPQVVGQTVGSLMPRVTVSGSGGTSTSSTSTSTNGNNNTQSNPFGGNNNDFRRMMEMRNQFQGGQGGGQTQGGQTGGQGGGRGFGGGGFGGGGFGGGGFGGGGFGGGGGQGGGRGGRN